LFEANASREPAVYFFLSVFVLLLREEEEKMSMSMIRNGLEALYPIGLMIGFFGVAVVGTRAVSYVVDKPMQEVG